MLTQLVETVLTLFLAMMKIYLTDVDEKPNSDYFLEKSKILSCLEAILKDLKNMTYGRFTVGGYRSVMGLIEDIHDD